MALKKVIRCTTQPHHGLARYVNRGEQGDHILLVFYYKRAVIKCHIVFH